MKSEATRWLQHLIQSSRSSQLESDEFPQFYSLQMPTKSEAAELFASDESEVAFPMVVQEMAKSTDESNSAIEYNLQAGSEADLGFDGVAILELICHMAYTSAYNQLRTKEQVRHCEAVLVALV